MMLMAKKLVESHLLLEIIHLLLGVRMKTLMIIRLLAYCILNKTALWLKENRGSKVELQQYIAKW